MRSSMISPLAAVSMFAQAPAFTPAEIARR
jgi:hypothetical protein